jgi:hypothetical protein
MEKDTALALLEAERYRQDERWGTIQEHPHELASWILILQNQLDDAREALDGGDIPKVLTEIIHVGAVAVAALEQHGDEIYEEVS